MNYNNHGQEFRIEKLSRGLFYNSKPVWREWGVIVAVDKSTAERHARAAIKGDVRVVALAPGEGDKGYI